MCCMLHWWLAMSNILPIFLQAKFDNYQEYLRFTYNEAYHCGRIVEIIETVKNQPRNIPFDFEFNTVEGKKIRTHFINLLLDLDAG